MDKELIYIKDEEGFVQAIKSEDMKAEYIQITYEEYEEISGEKYYKEKFGRGDTRSK